MASPLRIYLSGSIRKGAADPRSPDHFWTRDDEEFIRANSGGPVELLNPAKTDISRQDFAINFGCDLYLVLPLPTSFLWMRGGRKASEWARR